MTTRGCTRGTMKHLTTSFLLLAAVILCGLVPAGWCADPAGEAGSGFIVVTNPPVTDFYTSNQYGASPFTISFFDRSRGADPMTWHWDFGDGTTSDRQNPTHTFKTDGEFTISLTVTNQYGSNTRTIPAYIGVGNPPLTEFSAMPVEGDVPLAVKFTDASTNRPSAWNWNFGDGSSSTERDPTHTYTKPGVYFVTLRVSNHFGSDGLTKSSYIHAGNPAPVSPVTPQIPEKKRPEGFAGLVQEARGSMNKNLPTSGLIPPQFMAFAAVLTSLAILVIQIIVANIGFIWQFVLKFAKFFSDLILGHAVEKLSEKEIAARKLEVRKMEQRYLGLSATELLVIEIAILIVALAFMLADRAELTLEMVLIYIIVGAVSVVLHDFAHRYFATKHGQDADTQFWGLGTGIMFLTAWLFGNAFGASYRNLVNRNDDAAPEKVGLEMVAGPVVSIALMFIFLGMVTLGGVWAVAGGIGFTINLITAVYSLMPIETMDGLAIWRWNKGLYLALLVPMFLFYCYTFMLVE
jgi:PKD repeat protein